MEEVWKVYKVTHKLGRETRVYEVSSYGNVRVNGESIELVEDKGYLVTSIGKFRVHRIVATTFWPDKFPKGKRMEVHHKDFNKHNNALSNLIVLTPSEHRQEHFANDPAYEVTRKKMGYNSRNRVVTDKTRELMAAARTGKSSWNKGLTKETDERVAKCVRAAIEANKGKVWMNNGKDQMLVFPPWDQDMLIFGWQYGQLKRKRPAWNKGLTKETDERVAKYGRTCSKTKKGKN